MVENMKSMMIDRIRKKQEGFSPKIAITGEPQAGKSSFCYVLCQELAKPDKWDYKKFCALNFKDFVQMVDKYDHEIIVIEESSWQYSKMSFWEEWTQLMNAINQTQGYKRNIYIFVMPSTADIAKSLREVNYLFCVSKKIESKKMAIVMPQEIKIDYWRIDDKNLHQDFSPRIMRKTYTDSELAEASEYTKWLESYKRNIMEDIKSRVGVVKYDNSGSREIYS